MQSRTEGSTAAAIFKPQGAGETPSWLEYITGTPRFKAELLPEWITKAEYKELIVELKSRADKKSNDDLAAEIALAKEQLGGGTFLQEPRHPSLLDSTA
jgi:hypothetical protein